MSEMNKEQKPPRCPKCKKVAWACICEANKMADEPKIPFPKIQTLFKLPSGRIVNMGRIIDCHADETGADDQAMVVLQLDTSQGVREFGFTGEDAEAVMSLAGQMSSYGLRSKKELEAPAPKITLPAKK